jgi:hypothetical protein
VCGEPGVWWRGMNRKKSKAEQPIFYFFGGGQFYDVAQVVIIDK